MQLNIYVVIQVNNLHNKILSNSYYMLKGGDRILYCSAAVQNSVTILHHWI